jgi:hypothetical protein
VLEQFEVDWQGPSPERDRSPQDLPLPSDGALVNDEWQILAWAKTKQQEIEQGVTAPSRRPLHIRQQTADALEFMPVVRLGRHGPGDFGQGEMGIADLEQASDHRRQVTLAGQAHLGQQRLDKSEQLSVF